MCFHFLKKIKIYFKIYSKLSSRFSLSVCHVFSFFKKK